jgi:prophage antirepressor-like protein
MKTNFNETVQKFNHNVFGNLSVIRSQQENGKFWFIGKEIQKILGFQNLNQAIKQADLDDDEIFILTQAKHPKFWKDFMGIYRDQDDILKISSSETPLFTKTTGRVTFISESGFYGLISRSRKPIAKEFNRWVRKEVLPMVRKTFELSNTVQGYPELMQHLNEQVQKDYSTIVNKINHGKGGVKKIVDFNVMICKDHSGKKPYQWKKFGEKKGLPASKVTSALNVLRVFYPEISCAISFTKSLYVNGVDYEKAISISMNHARPLFNALIENNIMPREINFK